MSTYLIEVKRDGRWNIRAAGDLSEIVTREKLLAELPKLSRWYDHRLFIDGRLALMITAPGTHDLDILTPGDLEAIEIARWLGWRVPG